MYDIFYNTISFSLEKLNTFQPKKAQNLLRLEDVCRGPTFVMFGELRIKIIIYSTVSTNKVVILSLLMHISCFH
jgi:hypothetical protein